MTRAEDPSGATSQSRTARSARGSSAETSTVRAGAPRISTHSSSGSLVNASERSSSRLWSTGEVSVSVHGHQAPASRPVLSGEDSYERVLGRSGERERAVAER